jgi:hypothetical protein
MLVTLAVALVTLIISITTIREYTQYIYWRQQYLSDYYTTEYLLDFDLTAVVCVILFCVFLNSRDSWSFGETHIRTRSLQSEIQHFCKLSYSVFDRVVSASHCKHLSGQCYIYHYTA